MAGQFMSAIGGMTPAIQEALQRRQGSTPNQVSTASPSFDPTTQPASPVTGSAPSGTVPGGASGSMQSPESTLIVKALSERLKKL